MPSDLETQFDRALLDAAKRCSQLGYKPAEFLRMLQQRGGLETARSLLHSHSVSSGFTRLWELHRLDLSVEAHILQPAWRQLFTQVEQDKARKRLLEYQYTVEEDEKVAKALHPVDEEVDAVEFAEVDSGGPRPSNGMFGVKLIYPDHLRFPYFCDVYAPNDRRKALMNFKATSRNIKAAQSIPTGHRALVFTRQHIVWAIEFIGPLDDGKLIALHGVKPSWPTPDWSAFRPIRFLARMNVTAETFERGMHRHEIQARSGVDRRSYGGGHFYISEEEYCRMDAVVPWDWRCDGAAVSSSAAPMIVGQSQKARSVATAFILPPVANAESLVNHVRTIVGQPERNMEDAVKDLLVRLGHPTSAIRFQIGRMDVAVEGDGGRTLFVFEVKRSLANSSMRDDALRKGFDYANRTGARYVVISDADRYELYDRTKGLDHASMLCGSFRLTEFRTDDVAAFDVLRSRS